MDEPAKNSDPAPPDPPRDPPEGSSDEPDEHRFAADEEVADGSAGAKEARTPGMGS